jgi:hypothetical protein
MSEELELETPVDVEQEEVEVEETPESSEETPEEEPKPEEPFLSVNDRTVYKSKDDAIRGYNEAANRIQALSAWEKTAKQYGLTDAKQLEEVAKELLAAREKLAAAAKAAGAPKVNSNDPKVKEREQVSKYLKDLGYISKEDQEAALKELRDQVAEMRQSGQRSEEVRFQNQEAEARNDLKSWMSTAGIKDDAQGTKETIVGTLIKDWINSSEERIGRWSNGGVSAKALVKEGYDLFTKQLGWAAAKPAGNAPLKPTDPGYAAAKAKQVAANKKLPASGTGKQPAKETPKQKGAINAALHEKAWKVFQDAQGE